GSRSSGTSMLTVPEPRRESVGSGCSTSTVHPSRSRSWAMTCTSRMSGTLWIVLRPGASRVAAISFSEEFFAPPTSTVPRSGRTRGPSDRSRKASLTPATIPRGSRLVVMVNLTRIYTRTGDGGQTRLGDMSETTKNDLRLHAYADVDEANAHVGHALAAGELEPEVRAILTTVQNDLFDVGADFCTPVVPDPEFPPLRI